MIIKEKYTNEAEKEITRQYSSDGVYIERDGNLFTVAEDVEENSYNETDIEIEYGLSPQESVQKRIDEIIGELASYDYIGVKIATGVATIEEYADKIAYCETLRKKVNELQEFIEPIESEVE